MAYGRPASVRSHRRGGSRRRPKVAPWIVVSLVVVLVLSGLTAGYVHLMRQSCSGQAKAQVIASSATATILDNLARRWATTEPEVDGVCASVQVTAKDSALMAQVLQEEWDAKANGPAPDVWVPQSTAWVRRATVDADAERMIPDRQPSIARSPVVIAMPKPMAQALGWPKAKLSWQDIITKFADNPRGWSSLGKPWGPFRFGMTNPAKSTAGLLALTAITDANDDSDVSAEEQATVLKLKQVMRPYLDSTDQILSEFKRAGDQSEAAALQYVSAFPAFEQDVLNHNLRNPRVSLVAVYPNNGSIEADHPYLVLNAPWAKPQAQQVANAFMSYVRGADGRRQLMDSGFRDPNRGPGPQLVEQNGLAPHVTALPRAALLPDSVSRTLTIWTALTQPTNLLLVLDVSGSMSKPVAGSGQTRLTLARKAAKEAIQLFPDDAQVGLWAFSTRQNGTRDYRTVVPLGALGDVDGGRTRKDALLAGLDGLQPGGDTGLYDTVAAAQKTLLDSYRKGATNLVVLLTDGKNDDSTGGLSIAQLREQLTKNGADAARRVPVVLIGFGDEVDLDTLQELSRMTGATARSSRDELDINQVLISAIFASTG